MSTFQCIIPVIEGFFPKRDNNVILDLLFALAQWQAYAKLRLHTESTLRDFENATTLLGNLLRKFKKTVCERYITKELPSEMRARGRRTALLAAKAGKPVPNTKKTNTTKIVKFNMNTYKIHALADYPAYIRLMGTTDNYSTQMVCILFFVLEIILMGFLSSEGRARTQAS